MAKAAKVEKVARVERSEEELYPLILIEKDAKIAYPSRKTA